VAAQRIQSASRAVELLSAVARSERGLTAAEISAALGLSRPTAYHLINTLLEERFLYKEDGRFVLGLAVGDLADGFSRQMTPAPLIPRAEALARRTGESTSVCMRRGRDLTISYRSHGDSPVMVYDNMLGEMTEPHARASGKALLAFAPKEVQDMHLSGRLSRRTPATRTSRAELEGEFEEIRANGYAIDVGEYVSDVSCVAARARESDTIVLTVSVPTTRFAERRDALIATACEIAADL
jgi:DNA-binding IclR family transcriptional regulator